MALVYDYPEGKALPKASETSQPVMPIGGGEIRKVPAPVPANLSRLQLLAGAQGPAAVDAEGNVIDIDGNIAYGGPRTPTLQTVLLDAAGVDEFIISGDELRPGSTVECDPDASSSGNVLTSNDDDPDDDSEYTEWTPGPVSAKYTLALNGTVGYLKLQAVTGTVTFRLVKV